VKDLSFVSKLLRYVRDPRVASWKKLSGLLAVVYIVSPIDFVPDVFPIVGWLDDLGVLGAFATFMIRDVKKHSRALDQAPEVELNPPPPPKK
jgi:uncharacterized membrane protein YkvA (DUF1232 family)